LILKNLPSRSGQTQGIAMEIDILAVDERDVVLVECKSELSQDDVDEFIEKLTRFKIAFPITKTIKLTVQLPVLKLTKA